MALGIVVDAYEPMTFWRALEPYISERAFRAFLGGMRQDRLELVLRHADETVLGTLWRDDVPPSADLCAPEGRMVGGEVAVRSAEIALQFDGIAR